MSLDHLERESNVGDEEPRDSASTRPAGIGDAAELAEQSVLGGLLLDNGAWRRVADIVTSRDFDRLDHKLIFDAIGALISASKPADVVTVYEHLQVAGKAEESGGMLYLNALAQSVPSAANMRRYAEIARERSDLRQEAALRARAAALLRSGGRTPQVLRELRRIVAELEAPERVAGAARFPLIDAAALCDLPRKPDRVRGVLPMEGFAGVYGPSGAGKSFFITSIMAAICEGSAKWFGRRVRPGRCMYAALEGQAGVPRRIAAWEVTHGRPFPHDALFMLHPFRITERDDVTGLADAIKAAGGVDVLIIDTLNRAAPDVDENSSADMGRVIEGARDLQSATGGLVVLVHHSGKDAQRGMRGHSSLFAALDAAIEVSRVDDRREWKVTKSKDGEDGAVHPFFLRQVELGEDDEGAPITSCVVMEPAPDGEAGPATAPRARPPKGGNQKIVFDALGPLLSESDVFGRGGAPAIRPCITVDAAVEGTRGRLAVEAKRHGERARAAITGLIAAGVLGSGEGWLWLR
jgi:hypothetical protein